MPAVSASQDGEIMAIYMTAISNGIRPFPESFDMELGARATRYSAPQGDHRLAPKAPTSVLVVKMPPTSS